MVKKREKLFSKVVMIIFTVLIVLGFTVPGFLNQGEDQSYSTVEPRLCQSDADCYLMCDNIPQEVLCNQNLCLRNACDEYNLFAYSDPIEFILEVEIEGEKQPLIGKENDLFVKFSGDTVQLFADRLALRHILDKAGMRMENYNGLCLYTATGNYCDGEKKLSVFVDGNETFVGENLIPHAGEVVKITYS